MSTTTEHTTAISAWAADVPLALHRMSMPYAQDPIQTAVALVTAGIGDPYVLYERAGVVHVAAGASAVLRASATHLTAHTADGAWTIPTAGRPLDRIAEALQALAQAQQDGRRAYGWATFELAHQLHGRDAGEDTLVHLFLPCVEVALSPGRATVRATDADWQRKAADLLTTAPSHHAPAPGTRPDSDMTAADPSHYREAVAEIIEDIRAGRLDKAVLSRSVPLGHIPVDLPATYLAGRAANTPARSFLLDLGGWQAAGFSPETVVEVGPDGRVATQPLAGTRALGPDTGENERLRRELLADPKEVHEHAISVRLACREIAEVCRPDSVVVEEFMEVKERGSVQHLASMVSGKLRDDLGPWDALGALFPAVTATGVPKRQALAALSRYEDGPRGLYGGAVITADTDGALDAALVLRTIFHRGSTTWLRAGAGIMGGSTPEREFEETREKLRSVAPYIRRPGE
ncbi:salicylate synthase [Streptomyces polygonati]|uniref:Salicylate synthase n=1 Tax=Streptomyces polygonati TaxID=1617087 RepID=A0ABV8HV11_9ACTN